MCPEVTFRSAGPGRNQPAFNVRSFRPLPDIGKHKETWGNNIASNLSCQYPRSIWFGRSLLEAAFSLPTPRNLMLSTVTAKLDTQAENVLLGS